MKVPYALKEKPEVIPPENGWKNHTYYLVEVSYSSTNPTHLAILGVGFVGINAPPGTPGNYSEFWNNSYDRPHRFSEAYYIRALQELVTLD